MALTLTKLGDSEDVWGKHRVSVWDVALDNSYPTNGYAVTAAQFGLRILYGMKVIGGGNAAGLARIVGFRTDTSKLQAFNPTNTTPSVGAASEVPNATDLSGLTIRFLVYGE